MDRRGDEQRAAQKRRTALKQARSLSAETDGYRGYELVPH
jgi:hypothetical protein